MIPSLSQMRCVMRRDWKAAGVGKCWMRKHQELLPSKDHQLKESHGDDVFELVASRGASIVPTQSQCAGEYIV